MNYVTNADGEIKVRTETGVEKFLPKSIIENKAIMKAQGLTPIEAPVVFKETKKPEVETGEGELKEAETGDVAEQPHDNKETKKTTKTKTK